MTGQWGFQLIFVLHECMMNVVMEMMDGWNSLAMAVGEAANGHEKSFALA